MLICDPIIIVPQQDGVESALQIIVRPKSDKVTVLALLQYDECGAKNFPTHLVNEMFEASARVHELVKELHDAKLATLDAYGPCKCAVHLHHLLDGEPVVCVSLASAMLVAKTIADHT